MDFHEEVVFYPENRIILPNAEGEVVEFGNELKKKSGSLEVVQRQETYYLECVEQTPKEIHQATYCELKNHSPEGS